MINANRLYSSVFQKIDVFSLPQDCHRLQQKEKGRVESEKQDGTLRLDAGNVHAMIPFFSVISVLFLLSSLMLVPDVRHRGFHQGSRVLVITAARCRQTET